MPHANNIASSTAPSGEDRKGAVSEALLCLAAIVLTVIDLCRRLLLFFLRGICRMCAALIVITLLAAVAILAYCILMALSLVLGPALNSQLP